MKSADIISFPDPSERKKRHSKKRRQARLIDCLFGEIDLFRLLRDSEEKIIALRRKNKRDPERNP